MKYFTFLPLFFASFLVQAQDNISYSYFEVGVEHFDSDLRSINGLFLEGTGAVSESIYLGGFYSNLDAGSRNLQRTGAIVGFHTEIASITDFYSQLELGIIDQFSDSFTYGAKFGTRTAITEAVELNTGLSYTQVEDANDGFYEFGLEGLYKFNDQVALKTELGSLDGDLNAKLGFRFIF
ncbi:hypothetical protein OS175_01505 [Marinicella sp. S1101]|uniref:hypothetical protein n=1 Tax=Marinicella marina TaxID=2996016 RepID=UPI002260BE6E|nr:hypothetical protein [Marinicella marina]MCX7552538.1 hypothetical protein [Marinicella marina]MDJ1139414.1 hypothetical protein [Marinicella marina]